jgi:hypothetical protein
VGAALGQRRTADPSADSNEIVGCRHRVSSDSGHVEPGTADRSVQLSRPLLSAKTPRRCTNPPRFGRGVDLAPKSLHLTEGCNANHWQHSTQPEEHACSPGACSRWPANRIQIEDQYRGASLVWRQLSISLTMVRLRVEFLQQRLGVFQVGGVEALGEPVVGVGERRARLLAAAFLGEQSGEAHCRAQFQ